MLPPISFYYRGLPYRPLLPVYQRDWRLNRLLQLQLLVELVEPVLLHIDGGILSRGSPIDRPLLQASLAFESARTIADSGAMIYDYFHHDWVETRVN